MAEFVINFYVWVSLLYYSQVVSSVESFGIIDSLTKVQTINSKTILITFGADAVSAIETRKGIVVIDAGISSGLTRLYRKIIENKFGRNDFIYVINTHGHPDHYGGNSAFNETKIIGQINCLNEISQQWKNPEKTAASLSKIVREYESKLMVLKSGTEEWSEVFIKKTRYLNAYYDAVNRRPVKLPDLTFSDSLNIDLSDLTFEMFYIGQCHSSSDILIYVTGIKILFTGDLFSKYGRLSLDHSLFQDKSRWVQAVQWIERRIPDIDYIISGHGQILTIDDLANFNSNLLNKCN